MKTHKVKNPFWCRKDQFAEKGIPGQALVVGIALKALVGDTYRMTIGNNPDVFEAPTADIMIMGDRWINPKSQLVLITPVSIFKKGDRHDSER